jgi:SIR2-like domain
MRAGRLRIAWTTNFDPLIADACARVFGGTGSLTTVTPDAPEIASQLVSDGRWPLEIKLHGDFRSRRLRNTTDELRHQDAQLRADLLDLCKLSGLVIVGYSGRDESIMDCLQNAVATGGFPSGLFWLHRGEAPPLARVETLLEQASDQGIECGLVPIDNFDECLRDLVRLIPELDTKVLDEFTSSRRRWSPAPRPAGRAGWPVVRLNALPIVEMPTFCRRVVCGVGGYAETRAAFEAAACDVPFARARAGVLCFGEDDDIRAALSSFGIEEFDLSSIEPRRLRYESAECGLLRDALARAVARTHRMNAYRQRNMTLLAPIDSADDAWSDLRRIVGELHGTVESSADLQWSEGVSLRLAWADHRPWLLFEPRTVFRGISDFNRAAAADFARERTVKRYNRQLNDLFAFWAEKLAGNGEEIVALGVHHGVDAAFRLSGETAFSKRAR